MFCFLFLFFYFVFLCCLWFVLCVLLFLMSICWDRLCCLFSFCICICVCVCVCVCVCGVLLGGPLWVCATFLDLVSCFEMDMSLISYSFRIVSLFFRLGGEEAAYIIFQNKRIELFFFFLKQTLYISLYILYFHLLRKGV